MSEPAGWHYYAPCRNCPAPAFYRIGPEPGGRCSFMRPGKPPTPCSVPLREVPEAKRALLFGADWRKRIEVRG